ncbi:hypothetical protein DPMN_115492 [Dreissena polymorpha]|uniref:Uncharacterized protein n=1 Tax=Dreissena polymorpha TaxID=45954 RepID=A0A9D4KM25_DREPO|nr:hypothetical protein DPMN_115492 [Dreissena polymorpha]
MFQLLKQFKRGSFTPVSDRGTKSILSVVASATRYPEATVLQNIEANTVAGE